MRIAVRLTLAASFGAFTGAFSSAACQSPATATVPTAHPAPAWSQHAVIYEVNVRQFTPEGTLRALLPHLPRLQRLGVDILWIMPVQPIGKLKRKGTLGSYYSISNYRAINPEYGTAGDFKAVVDSAHRLGMKVILDWVPNHTAFDHPWTTQHRDFYVIKPDGTISNARDDHDRETDWTDVAELNYDNPALRASMIGEMRWWVDTMNVDGFRQDVAGGVPMDFWREARRSLDADRPGLFMLAEGEDPAMHAAFEMTYGWEFHHLLNELAQGKKSTAELDTYFADQARRYPAGAYRMYFTSNHDENSWNGTEFERMGPNHLPAFILSATVINSMPLLYTGQEASMNKRLRFFDKDTVDWSGPSLASFYQSVFELKDRAPALWNGSAGGSQAKLENDGGDRVYAFTRLRGPSAVVVAVNFGDAPAQMHYKGLTRTGNYTDWFSKSAVVLAAAGSLDIPAHGYRVLVR